MIKNSITLARPYAKAAYSAALQSGEVSQWEQGVSVLGAAVKNDYLQIMLKQVGIDKAAKKDALLALVEKPVKGLAELLDLLLGNKRIFLLSDIAKLFRDFVKQEKQEIDFTIISARDLSEPEKNKISQALVAKHSGKVNLMCEVDRSLIGGFVVRGESMVLDASIKGRLGKLTKLLVK